MTEEIFCILLIFHLMFGFRPQITDTEMETILNDIVDGLFAVCVTLAAVPIIRFISY